jgi:hypothetical protein
MSVIKDTLRTMIDRNVAGYIDEVVKALIVERKGMEEKIRKLAVRIEALESAPTSPEEQSINKETLTKVKLIKLMKDMGYYE